MRIHALPFRKIHIAILRMPMDFRKRRAGRLIEKNQPSGSMTRPFGRVGGKVRS
jgi:hypothetical protein